MYIVPIVPQPGDPIFAPEKVIFPYYSGTARAFQCQFPIAATFKDDSDITLTQGFWKDDDDLAFDSRVSKNEITEVGGSNFYSGSVAFDYLTLMDFGSYHCDVIVSSSVENEFIHTTSSTATIAITIQGTIEYCI